MNRPSKSLGINHRYKLTLDPGSTSHDDEYPDLMKLGQYVIKKDKDIKIITENLEDHYYVYDREKFQLIDSKVAVMPKERYQRPPEDEADYPLELEGLQMYFMSNPEKYLEPKLQNSKLYKRLIDVDFITDRGTLHTLMKLAYIRDEDFTIYAEKNSGVIYLAIEKSENSNDSRRDVLDAKLKIQIYSTNCKNKKYNLALPNETSKNEDVRKFTKLCDEIKRRDNHDLFYLYQTQIKDQRILFTSRMNCFKNDESLQKTDRFGIGAIEMHTAKLPVTDEDYDYLFENRAVDWWTHLALIDANKVVIYYTEGSKVVRFQEFLECTLKAKSIIRQKLDETGKIVQEADFLPRVCYRNLNDILSFIKSCYEDDVVKKLKLRLLKFEFKKGGDYIICDTSSKDLLTDEYKAKAEKVVREWKLNLEIDRLSI